MKQILSQYLDRVNIAVIGEVSVGKTTLLSNIFQQTVGLIKRQRSTFNYHIFIENLSIGNFPIVEFPTDESDQSFSYQVPSINFIDSDRKYLINIIDTIGFNDSKLDSNNYQHLQTIQPFLDVIIVVLDIQKCFETTSEHELFKQLDLSIPKIVVLNKCDDLDDPELVEFEKKITASLIKHHYISQNTPIVCCSSLNVYNASLNGSSSQGQYLSSKYGNYDRVFDLFGFKHLKTSLKSLIDLNLLKIYQKKITKIVEDDNTNIVEIFELYQKFQWIVELPPFSQYLLEADFSKIENYSQIAIHIEPEVSLKLFKEYLYIFETGGNLIDDLPNWFDTFGDQSHNMDPVLIKIMTTYLLRFHQEFEHVEDVIYILSELYQTDSVRHYCIFNRIGTISLVNCYFESILEEISSRICKNHLPFIIYFKLHMKEYDKIFSSVRKIRKLLVPSSLIDGYNQLLTKENHSNYECISALLSQMIDNYSSDLKPVEDFKIEFEVPTKVESIVELPTNETKRYIVNKLKLEHPTDVVVNSTQSYTGYKELDTINYPGLLYVEKNKDYNGLACIELVDVFDSSIIFTLEKVKNFHISHNIDVQKERTDFFYCNKNLYTIKYTENKHIELVKFSINKMANKYSINKINQIQIPWIDYKPDGTNCKLNFSTNVVLPNTHNLKYLAISNYITEIRDSNTQQFTKLTLPTYMNNDQVKMIINHTCYNTFIDLDNFKIVLNLNHHTIKPLSFDLIELTNQDEILIYNISNIRASPINGVLDQQYVIWKINNKCKSFIDNLNMLINCNGELKSLFNANYYAYDNLLHYPNQVECSLIKNGVILIDIEHQFIIIRNAGYGRGLEHLIPNDVRYSRQILSEFYKQKIIGEYSIIQEDN